jgi:hypothetical protein
MDIMFDDKSKPLFVVMFQYADYDETLNVHEYMGWLKDICENYITQWQSVGGQAVYFLFGGTIMGDGGLGGADTAERRAQCELENEAMWRVAQERNDVYFVVVSFGTTPTPVVISQLGLRLVVGTLSLTSTPQSTRQQQTTLMVQRSMLTPSTLRSSLRGSGQSKSRRTLEVLVVVDIWQLHTLD